ncbi:hypothetical protein [Streptomyces acidicola]|uniref:hypothetical protein n=1 Tax=Streptomyces acidicola TaxID=2596892 RepID=UPI0037F199E6
MTEVQLRSLFGEGWHPDAGRLVAEQLAAGEKPTVAYRDGALGYKVTVTGVDLVFRPQATLQLRVRADRRGEGPRQQKGHTSW